MVRESSFAGYYSKDSDWKLEEIEEHLKLAVLTGIR